MAVQTGDQQAPLHDPVPAVAAGRRARDGARAGVERRDQEKADDDRAATQRGSA